MKKTKRPVARQREDIQERRNQPGCLFKTEVESARDRSRATALKTLLEANARWNEERRDTSTNDLRRIVDETSTIYPDLRKELL